MSSLKQLTDIIYEKFVQPKDVRGSFRGRNVLITGANTGIGFEAAIKFVEQGAAKVIIAVRSIEKGEVAKAKIETRTGIQDVAHVWRVDMLDYESIVALAHRVDLELAHLDIAVLNAGLMAADYERTKYGIEKTLQVWVLQHFSPSCLTRAESKRFCRHVS